MVTISSTCLNCNIDFTHQRHVLRKFCSNKCSHEYNVKTGSRAGKNNASYNPNKHNILCKCGCGKFLKSYYEIHNGNGYIAYHDKERILKSSRLNAKLAIVKTKKILLEKYGVTNPAQVVGAMKKRETTWLKKYGVINAGALVFRPSNLELQIANLLKSLNVEFQSQFNINGWLYDFGIPHKKIVIECDGTYWHSFEKVKIRDTIKTVNSESYGFTIIRFTENQIKFKLGDCENIIKKLCL